MIDIPDWYSRANSIIWKECGLNYLGRGQSLSVDDWILALNGFSQSQLQRYRPPFSVSKVLSYILPWSLTSWCVPLLSLCVPSVRLEQMPCPVYSYDTRKPGLWNMPCPTYSYGTNKEQRGMHQLYSSVLKICSLSLYKLFLSIESYNPLKLWHQIVEYEHKLHHSCFRLGAVGRQRPFLIQHLA